MTSRSSSARELHHPGQQRPRSRRGPGGPQGRTTRASASASGTRSSVSSSRCSRRVRSSPRTRRSTPCCEPAGTRAGSASGWAATSTCSTSTRRTRRCAVPARARSAREVHDPETAELLIPQGYPFGCKRNPLDSGYYETFNLPHVHLVDVKSNRSRRSPVRCPSGGRHRVRARRIVYATGFDAMTGPMDRIDIRGRGGRLLREKWAEGPRTYLGPDERRLPEPVHDHRPAEPVRAVEHAGLHRAARRLHRADHRRPARARRLDDRADSGGRGRLGGREPGSWPRRRSSRRPTPGTWAPTSPASRGCSCPTSASSGPYRAQVRRGSPTNGVRGLHHLRLPGKGPQRDREPLLHLRVPRRLRRHLPSGGWIWRRAARSRTASSR